MNGPIPKTWSANLLGLLRIVAAALLILHGTMKLFGWPPMEGMPDIAWLSRAGIAGMIETLGGTLVLLGIFTRPVAFLISGEMAFAYFLVHAKTNFFFPMLNGGEVPVLFCFLFLFIAAAGPGHFALERVGHTHTPSNT